MWNRYWKWISYLAYPFFLCLLFSNPTQGQGTWEFDSEDQMTYQNLLSLKTNSSLINLEKDRASTQYLKHFHNSIELLISDDQSQIKAYEKTTQQVLDFIKNQPKDSPYYKFYTADILLQSAFVHLKLGHEFTAGWELRRAYREINRNIKAYPDFVPQYKTIGLLHVIIGSVPEKYNWVLSIMGMEGTVKQGIEALTKLANSNNTFKVEGELLIMLMQAYLLQDTNASARGLKKLFNADHSNLLIGYLYVSVLMKSQQNELAIETINKINKELNAEHIGFPLLKYLLAEAFLRKGNYQLAIAEYQKFRNRIKGDNYQKDALYKMGLSYWLLNEQDSTSKYFRMAIKNGITLTEVDKHASKELNSELARNKKILEVRLLTDGGYYDKALEKLNLIKTTELNNSRDEIEFNYRKARIYHQSGQLNAAIAFYKLTINSGAKNNWYFAPNSALQLGFIYQEDDNKYLAEKYFNMALSYKDHEYKNSIDNKAKSALSTLK